MMNRHGVRVGMLAVALGAIGCSSKGDKGTGASPARTGSASAGTTSASKATTAEGGDVAATPTVTTCPKSLAGSERVHRVITKACGVVAVTGDYSVDDGTLTLEAGATLAFAPDAALTIGYYGPARLIVRGTADAPVTLTTSGDKAAGVWKGIVLAGHADRSTIEGLVLEYAGTAEHAAIDVRARDVTVKASTVRASRGPALAIGNTGALAAFTGNTIAEVGIPDALVVPPTAAASVAADNKLPPTSRIKVTGGKIATSVAWANLGVPYAVLEPIEIDGAQGRATLELAPGTTVLFGPDAGLSVGYYSSGGLKAIGTPAAPIRFSAFDGTEPGSWGEIGVHGKGEATFEHVVFERGGAKDDKGVLFAHGGTLSVKSCTFASDKRGAVLTGDVKLKVFDGNTFDGTAEALALGPETLGAIGATTYGAGARIEVAGGKIDQEVTWRSHAARIEITGTIEIDRGRLAVDGGNTLAFKDDAMLSVGYYEAGVLQLLGTPDHPIELRGLRDEPDAWKGIQLYGKARASVVRHTTIHGAGGDAAIRVDDGAELEVEDLACERCQAALRRTCKAKVTAKGVKALGGTPKAELAPPSCKPS